MNQYSSNKNNCDSIYLGIAIFFAIIFAMVFVCVFIAKNENNKNKSDDVHDSIYLYEGEFCYDGICEKAILLNDEINIKTFNLIEDKLTDGNFRWLCLNSPGGNVQIAGKISSLLAANNISTCVAPIKIKDMDVTYAASCSSSCSEIWFEGMNRTISSEKSFIGLHEYFIKSNCNFCKPINYLVAKFFSTTENIYMTVFHPNYREYREFYSLRDGCTEKTMYYIDANFFSEKSIKYISNNSYFITIESYKYKDFKKSLNCVR